MMLLTLRCLGMLNRIDCKQLQTFPFIFRVKQSTKLASVTHFLLTGNLVCLRSLSRSQDDFFLVRGDFWMCIFQCRATSCTEPKTEY
jgi:hypothetical protein